MADETKKGPQGQGKQDNGNNYRKTHSEDPGLTPGSAEGDEETVDKALEKESGSQKSK